MRAGVWRDIGVLVCEDWPEPEMSDDLVCVEVEYCGFCGSDPHIIEGHLRVGDPPQVIGHEVSGTVAAVGAKVQGFEVGDRVACNLYGYCGACPWCRAGHPNHCRRKFFAAKGFAERAVYKPEQVFVLPDEVSLLRGAFLEPVATCLHALEISELTAGETVAVLGAGAVGLLLVQLARLAGAGRIVVSEPIKEKRGLAREMGADVAIDPVTEDLRAATRAGQGRRGVDIVLEASGAMAAATAGPRLLSSRGRMVVIGIFPPDANIHIPASLLFDNEISIRGALAAGRTFERALALLPRLELDPLITAVEPIEAIDAVYARHRQGDAVKLLVTPNASE